MTQPTCPKQLSLEGILQKDPPLVFFLFKRRRSQQLTSFWQDIAMRLIGSSDAYAFFTLEQTITSRTASALCMLSRFSNVAGLLG